MFQKPTKGFSKLSSPIYVIMICWWPQRCGLCMHTYIQIAALNKCYALAFQELTQMCFVKHCFSLCTALSLIHRKTSIWISKMMYYNKICKNPELPDHMESKAAFPLAFTFCRPLLEKTQWELNVYPFTLLRRYPKSREQDVALFRCFTT